MTDDSPELGKDELDQLLARPWAAGDLLGQTGAELVAQFRQVFRALTPEERRRLRAHLARAYGDDQGQQE